MNEWREKNQRKTTVTSLLSTMSTMLKPREPESRSRKASSEEETKTEAGQQSCCTVRFTDSGIMCTKL